MYRSGGLQMAKKYEEIFLAYIADFFKIFWKCSHYFFSFSPIFDSPRQCFLFAEIFITLEFFVHIFLAIWRPPLLYIYVPKLYQPIKSTHITLYDLNNWSNIIIWSSLLRMMIYSGWSNIICWCYLISWTAWL